MKGNGMKTLIIISTLAVTVGTANAQLTTCNPYGYGSYSCYTQQPNTSGGPLAAFLNGFIEGRMTKLKMEQLQLQNELLRRRLQNNN
jgi:hypothetical protein